MNSGNNYDNLYPEKNILESLSGTIEEMTPSDYAFPEPEETKDEQLPVSKTRERLMFALGLAISLLAIIGLINTAIFSVHLVGDIQGKTKLKNEVARFVYPVVIVDAPGFTGAANLLPRTVVSTSVWKVILEGNTAEYEKTVDFMVVPAADVEAAAAELYGTITVEHQTIDEVDIIFEYDPTRNSYIVPENPRYFSYTPSVDTVQNIGDKIIATVAYIAPSPLEVMNPSYNNPPVKSMIYTITRTGDTMRIDSLEIKLNEVQYGN
ncbi:MAG: hypothetical protein LBN40_04850 [Oscillospiraceae bacterium]|jgi:hypothetical protein|nr:hypothetical protein [Oscillospiraceae bacterium]